MSKIFDNAAADARATDPGTSLVLRQLGDTRSDLMREKYTSTRARSLYLALSLSGFVAMLLAMSWVWDRAGLGLGVRIAAVAAVAVVETAWEVLLRRKLCVYERDGAGPGAPGEG